MDIKITQLRKKDFNTARKFAIEGMHLAWYTSNSVELYLYSKYFRYLEISRATRALGAYINDVLVGVIELNRHTRRRISDGLQLNFFRNTFAK